MVDPLLGITVRFWLRGGGTGCPVWKRSGATPLLVPFGPISSATAGTDPLHPNATSTQRVPSPTAPARVREGGTAGQGAPEGTHGEMCEEKQEMWEEA